MIYMDRTNAVSQAFLRWAHRNRRSQPPNAWFLKAPESAVDGRQVDADELEEVLELLLHRGLIEGPKGFTEYVPNPAELTREGVMCVVDHGADVQRWNAGNGMSYINQPVTVTGNGNQVAAFSTNVNQNQRTEMHNVQTLRDVAERAIGGLDEYEIDPDDAETVRNAAEKVLSETANGELEPGRLAKIARSLHAALQLFFSTAIGTEFARQLMDLIVPFLTAGAA
ncbi:MAG: hypothetical protein AB7I38_18940 [Dehalococcoidia bacterium]